MSDHVSNDQSLFGRVFDSYQNMMQIARCIAESMRQRGVNRVRVLELSRRETGLADYLAGAEVLRYVTHEDNQPILSNPLKLPFADKSWDVTIVTDVYEHIPAEMRPSLLSEMIRVTHGLVLLACPQENELVSRFDKMAFDFVWGKYAERFEPLEQHHEFGLESLTETESLLRSQGADQVVALPCNFVYRWIHMILVYFDLQHRHTHWDLFEPLNRIYNQHLAAYDYREPCYRYLMVVPTDPAIDMPTFLAKLQGPTETPELVAETDTMLVKTFEAVNSATSDRLRKYTAEAEIAQKELQRLRGEEKRLLDIVEKLQKDNAWALEEIEMLRKKET